MDMCMDMRQYDRLSGMCMLASVPTSIPMPTPFPLPFTLSASYTCVFVNCQFACPLCCLYRPASNQSRAFCFALFRPSCCSYGVRCFPLTGIGTFPTSATGYVRTNVPSLLDHTISLFLVRSMQSLFHTIPVPRATLFLTVFFSALLGITIRAGP